MIPYFTWTSIQVGPLTLHVWGIMVALGILVGAAISAKFAEKKGLDKEVIYSGATWVIIAALLGARAFHAFIYHPSVYFSDPLEILRVWNGGMSVMGGFLGAIVGYTLFIKAKKITWMEYADAFIYGLPLGLGCGRIGCFLIHDHPGTLTNSPLGVQYPDGVRHDHGLYLSINGFLLALAFFFLQKKTRPRGFFIQVFLIWYGIVRFFLDFYRVIDRRFMMLTPAQYISLFMVILGSGWMYHSFLARKKQN